VALSTFAAVLLLLTGHAPIDQYFLVVGPTAANPQQQHVAAG